MEQENSNCQYFKKLLRSRLGFAKSNLLIDFVVIRHKKKNCIIKFDPGVAGVTIVLLVGVLVR